MKSVLLGLSFLILFLTANVSKAVEPQTITVALVTPGWDTGLPTAVARGAGFFRDEGLEVRPVTLASSGPIMMAVLMSGQADYVIAGGVATLRAIERGAPVSIVSGHLSRLSYALIGGKMLKTVGDLKDKTIGITGIGGLGEFAVVEALKRKGLIRDRDFAILNIEGGAAARMAALKAGKVDSIPLTPGQRVQAEAEGFPILFEVRESLPEIPAIIVASTQKFMRLNPNTTVKFLRGLTRGMNLIRQDKDKAVALGKSQGLRGDVTVERKALNYYVNDLDIEINKNNIEALLKLLNISGVSEKFFDGSYLTRALAQ